MDFIELRESDDEWNDRRRISHQGTFNANPVSAAAGLEMLRLISEGGECGRADATAGNLVRALNATFREEAVPGSAWAISSMWHLNQGYDAPMPVEVEWDAMDEPS